MGDGFRKQTPGCLNCFAALFVLGAVVLILSYSGIFSPETKRFQLGTVRVYETSGATHVFAEVEVITHRPGLFISPTRVSIPGWHGVFALSSHGVRSRNVFRSTLSLSPNLSRIIPLHDRLYLLSTAGSEDAPPIELYELRAEGFAPVSAEESHSLLAGIGVGSQESAVRALEEADKFLEGSDWEWRTFPRYLDGTFKSDVSRVRILLDARGEDQGIEAESVGTETRWSEVLLKIDARPKIGSSIENVEPEFLVPAD